jgi:hypothetical protein
MSKKDIKLDRFKALVGSGYSEKQANIMKDWKLDRIQDAIIKAFNFKAGNEEKKPGKTAVRGIARVMGFTPKEADRIRYLSLDNITGVFNRGNLSEAGTYFLSRSKDHIKYKNAPDFYKKVLKKGHYGRPYYVY